MTRNTIKSLRDRVRQKDVLLLEEIEQYREDIPDFQLLTQLAYLWLDPHRVDQNLLENSPSWNYKYQDLLGAELAAVQLLLGQPQEALEILTKIPLQDYDGVTYSRLATAKLILLDNLGALDAFEKASKLEPENGDFYNNLGGALVRVQRLEEALDCYDKALLYKPGHPQATQSRLQVARELGKGEGLLDELEAKVEQEPDNSEAKLALFHCLCRLRRTTEAVELIKSALIDFKTIEPVAPNEIAQDPVLVTQFAYRNALYGHFFQEHKWVNALVCLNQMKEMLTEVPLDLELRRFSTILEMKNFIQAEKLLEELSSREEFGKEHQRLLKGTLLFQKGEESKADDLLTQPFEHPMWEKQANNLRGQIALTLGRIEEVKEILLAVADEDIMAYVQLINSRNFTPDEEVINKLRSIADNVLLPEGVRNSICFALASVFDKRKEYDLAFNYLKRGNDIDAKMIGFRPEGFTQSVDRHIEFFTREKLDQVPRLPASKPRPIFVVGMPRSGTTLTETILGSHPEIAPAGELPAMSMLTRMMKRVFRDVSHYPKGLFELNKQQLIQMARGYLRQIPEECQSSAMIVDKMPHNFMNVGIISILFPNSPIIHVRRDPRDTALSNYQQNFGAKFGALGYASDLVHMAAQFNDYFRIMEHWRKIGIPMFEFFYEDLVSDQEGVTRQLLDYVGVDWDDKVKDFHKLERSVRTASVAQVRQKIYTSSKQKWRNYEGYLEPFIVNLNEGLTSPWD